MTLSSSSTRTNHDVLVTYSQPVLHRSLCCINGIFFCPQLFSKGEGEARKADSPTPSRRPSNPGFDEAPFSSRTNTLIPNSTIEDCPVPLDISRSQMKTRAQGAVSDTTGTTHALGTRHLSNQPRRAYSQKPDVAPSQATRLLVNDIPKLRDGNSTSHSGGQDDVQNTTKRRSPAQVSAYTGVPSVNASGGYVSATNGGTQAMAPSAVANSGQRDPPRNQTPSLPSISSKASSGRVDADNLVDVVSPVSSLGTPNPRDFRSKGSDSMSTKTHEASARSRPLRSDSSSAVPQKTAGTPGNPHVTTETVNSSFRQSPSYVRGSSIDSQAKQAPMQQDTDKPDMARRSGTSAQPSAHSRDVPIDAQAETLVSNDWPISTGSGTNAQDPINVRGAPTSHRDQSSVLSDPVVTGKRATTMRSGTYTQPSCSVQGVPHSKAERSLESLAANEYSMAKRSNTIAQPSDLLNDESQDGHSRTINDANKQVSCSVFKLFSDLVSSRHSEKSSVTPNNAFEVVGVDDLGKEDVIIA